MSSLLSILTVVGAAETVILVGLLVYRALLSMKEEDRLFLASGEAQLEREQLQLQARIVHLNKYAWALVILWMVTLLVLGGMYGYQELVARR